jgi:hypothetical protein
MLINRKKEQAQLRILFESKKPEFVALYGRRRVGKTFLIKEFFRGGFAFYVTGVANAGKKAQLLNFHESLCTYSGIELPLAKDWHESFRQLRAVLETDVRPGKKVVFIDEMPWLDTPKSGFVSALELFWNGWADMRPEILLITCGSASSWMLNQVIRSHGGLYNRVTQVLHLEPFTLGECRDFLREKRLTATDYQILEYYMVLGGIPFYLERVDPSLSITQNIDQLCFVKDARLRQEYRDLFASLFKEPGRHEAVVRTLTGKSIGLSRDEILKGTRLPDGGSFTKALDELETSGFIRRYRPFGRKQRGQLYQLIDFSTAFYLRFIEGSDDTQQEFWAHYSVTSAHAAWSGYAFEQVCLNHVQQIRRRLGIEGMISTACSWRSEQTQSKAQVDLVIDRSDNVIDLCEMKYSQGEFVMSRDYDQHLKERRNLFLAETGTRKAVRTVMVTTYGLKRNAYSGDYPIEVTASDLFA